MTELTTEFHIATLLEQGHKPDLVAHKLCERLQNFTPYKKFLEQAQKMYNNNSWEIILEKYEHLEEARTWKKWIERKTRGLRKHQIADKIDKTADSGIRDANRKYADEYRKEKNTHDHHMKNAYEDDVPISNLASKWRTHDEFIRRSRKKQERHRERVHDLLNRKLKVHKIVNKH